MNWQLMWDSAPKLLNGVPMTLQLVGLSLAVGVVLAGFATAARLSNNLFLRGVSWGYVFLFRGTPLLVQIFLIYYGLGQFEAVRQGFLWPFLREAYWCA
ncbi:ABC transporter permease subunit, partial [bacterium]|nr:ABC transporter permease subunit [bacterium]